MGKRKTRKRSRRSKKGGMFGMTAAEHGAKSLCVWYGNGNSGIKAYTYRTKDETRNKTNCGELVKNTIGIIGHEGISKKDGQIHSTKPEMIPNKMVHDSGILGIENPKLPTLIESDENMKFDIYMIKSEFECDHDGERFELFELINGKFEGKDDNGNYKLRTSKNELIEFKPRPTEPFGYDVIVHAKMGLATVDKQYSGTPSNAVYFVPKSSKRGGKKKRKRRRRSTKKKRRKSKRRRTKKRRRRR